jgi:hypothetical protein
MAWKVAFALDTDTKTIGTMTAADESGIQYTRRVNTADNKDIDAFVAEAIALKTTKSVEVVELKSIEDVVIGKLLAADTARGG